MKSILIIDSEREFSLGLKEFLRKEGYKLYSSYKAQEGLQKAIDKNPDLILMELSFTDMDGFDLIGRIKSENKLSDSLLAIYSHKKDDFLRVLALEMGADDYIQKTASFREVLLRIKSYFRYSRPKAI